MEFQKFNKIPRLSRDCIITEKIDGTNAQIYIVNYNTIDIAHDGCKSTIDYLLRNAIVKIDNKENKHNPYYVFAGSRTRWLDISSKGDNFGFAKWVQENAEELLQLGEGRHFGEWYGKGIQRGYGLDHKRFALFNVKKWNDDEIRPKCCDVVPILWQGTFDSRIVDASLELLKEEGSFIPKARYFKNPEGIVIFHTASGQLFKKTIVDDEKPKGQNDE